jgi:dTDP-4-amino-4,6-dideoxygalactose transaminase
LNNKTAGKSDSPGKMLFPFLDLEAQFNSIRDEIMPAVIGVMESQQFIMGREVSEFEREVAALIGASAAVSCASGSDALLLSLMALEIGPGDEVITTPFTFVATAASVARVGAKPVFVDIEPLTYNLDPRRIQSAINERTRAIIPVHLFGFAADLDLILKVSRQHRLAVIEDAAQAIGARYHGAPLGTWGTFGCFSFYPSKNLGGAGDGGLITTNDASLADRIRVLRLHGSRRKYQYESLGINSRLDALQAAILRVKLTHLGDWTKGRQEKAQRYGALLAENGLERRIQLPSASRERVDVYNQFVIRCPDRDQLREFLRERGIPTEIYYPTPLHLQPAFAYLKYQPGQFPEAEAASREVLALPLYPELKDEHQVAIVQAIAEFFKSGK